MTLEQKARYFAYENGLGELIDATQAARDRGETDLSTQVKGGLIRVVRSRYTRRQTTVTHLTGWLPITEATSFINTLSI